MSGRGRPASCLRWCGRRARGRSTRPCRRAPSRHAPARRAPAAPGSGSSPRWPGAPASPALRGQACPGRTGCGRGPGSRAWGSCLPRLLRALTYRLQVLDRHRLGVTHAFDHALQLLEGDLAREVLKSAGRVDVQPFRGHELADPPYLLGELVRGFHPCVAGVDDTETEALGERAGFQGVPVTGAPDEVEADDVHWQGG